MKRIITALILFMCVITGSAQLFVSHSIDRSEYNTVKTKITSGYGVGYFIEIMMTLDKKTPTYYLVINPDNSKDWDCQGKDPINCICFEYVVDGKLGRLGKKELSQSKVYRDRYFSRDTRICVKIDFELISKLYEIGPDRFTSLTFGCCRGDKYGRITKIVGLQLKPYQSRCLYSSIREIYEETKKLMACGRIK